MTQPQTTAVTSSVDVESPMHAAGARHATKVYGTGDTAVTALDDLSIELPRGQFTAIMGPSGSGKSTLMHCLAGLDTLRSSSAPPTSPASPTVSAQCFAGTGSASSSRRSTCCRR
jgi:ABC-type glutathione transport system ATPase component